MEIPKSFIVTRYFAREQAELDELQGKLDTISASLSELEEEHGGEEGAFGELDKINKGEVNKFLKEKNGDGNYADEMLVLKKWVELDKQQSTLRKQLKEADTALDKLTSKKYPQLGVDEIKTLVVDDKWLASLAASVHSEHDRVSQTLTGRIRQLAERYKTPLPQIVDNVADLSSRVDEHLKRMGAVWK